MFIAQPRAFLRWPKSEFRFSQNQGVKSQMVSGTFIEETSIDLAELKKHFKQNRLVAHPGVLANLKLSLPPDSSISVDASNNIRAIKIKTPFVTVTITITVGGGGPAQQGIWGVLPADPTDLNRYYAVQYLVLVSGELDRFRKYSPSMGAYRRWFENLSEALSEFDWQEVDRKTQETLTRKSISKTLGMPSN
jgi:hypothetical protein